MAGHSVAGSFGQSIRALLGISGKTNVRFDLFTYDANGFMTTVRIRVFNDSADATASTQDAVGLEGAIFSTILTATPDGVFATQPDDVLGIGS